MTEDPDVVANRILQNLKAIFAADEVKDAHIEDLEKKVAALEMAPKHSRIWPWVAPNVSRKGTPSIKRKRPAADSVTMIRRSSEGGSRLGVS